MQLETSSVLKLSFKFNDEDASTVSPWLHSAWMCGDVYRCLGCWIWYRNYAPQLPLQIAFLLVSSKRFLIQWAHSFYYWFMLVLAQPVFLLLLSMPLCSHSLKNLAMTHLSLLTFSKLPFLSKVLQKIMATQLLSFVEKMDIYKKGLPQGSILSPVLFLFYNLALGFIFHKHKHNVSFQCSADDVQILSSSTNQLQRNCTLYQDSDEPHFPTS